jgi:hypothetical protein
MHAVPSNILCDVDCVPFILKVGLSSVQYLIYSFPVSITSFAIDFMLGNLNKHDSVYWERTETRISFCRIP